MTSETEWDKLITMMCLCWNLISHIAKLADNSSDILEEIIKFTLSFS